MVSAAERALADAESALDWAVSFTFSAKLRSLAAALSNASDVLLFCTIIFSLAA
jgi:hypothetical protein